MRVCNKCNQEREDSQFRKRARSTDGVDPICKICKSSWEKENWKERKVSYSDTKNEKQKDRRVRNQKYVFKYLEGKSCIDCGESDPIILEFDHRDQDQKRDSVCQISNFSSILNLQKELDKCDVRCCNCHRRRTVEQLGWYSWRL